MNQQTQNRPLLTDTLPAFAAELQWLLTEAGESELAAQVPGLRIFERCERGDEICSTVYVKPRPKGAYGPGPSQCGAGTLRWHGHSGRGG